MARSTLKKTRLCLAVLTLGAATGALAAGPGGATAESMNTTPAATSATQTKALARSERRFIESAAKGGLAEVELGQLAQQKAQSEQVKQFGARMAQDHAKVNDELKQIAGAKAVEVPATPDKRAQKEMAKLQELSGTDFDREYMQLMVADHKHDVAAFQKEAKSGADADLRSFAAKTLPTLQEHLQLAQAAQSAVKSGKRAGDDTHAAK